CLREHDLAFSNLECADLHFAAAQRSSEAMTIAAANRVSPMPMPSPAPIAAPIAALPSRKPAPIPITVPQSPPTGKAQAPQRGKRDGRSLPDCGATHRSYASIVLLGRRRAFAVAAAQQVPQRLVVEADVREQALARRLATQRRRGRPIVHGRIERRGGPKLAAFPLADA